ncbi:MAG: hypothetical protein AB7H88_15545 [Vicinamibacterales bacterium]
MVPIPPMEMPPVYVAEPVSVVQQLYAPLVGAAARTRPLGQQLDLLAGRLRQGFADAHPGALVELAIWHPDAAAGAALRLPIEAARLAVAREHGFDDWAAVERARTRMPRPAFEAALDALLSGHHGELAAALDASPDLATARSHLGHGATLLHYLAASGVEVYRRSVPLNAAGLARLLLDRGADPKAPARLHGRPATVLSLLTTSAHPVAAGVDAAIIAILTS